MLVSLFIFQNVQTEKKLVKTFDELVIRCDILGQNNLIFFYISLYCFYYYRHYYECGWHQHVFKDNKPELKTCEKNAVYQPSKISKTHSTDGYTFVPNTGR